jgi:uncharacterized protein (DUF952 family)
MILHLVSKADWEAQPADQPYHAKSLDSEGFTHATKGEKLMLEVANTFYKDQPGEFLLLHIDESKLTSELKWEPPISPQPQGEEDGVEVEAPPSESSAMTTATEAPAQERPPEVKAEFGDAAGAPTPLFPHIYGPINREAIVGMRKFVRAADGAFTGFAQIDETAVTDAAPDPTNPLNLKTPSQMAQELLDATDEFSESLKRFKDSVEGRMAEIDEKIKKL